MRADEHEGDLNDTQVARYGDMRDAVSRKILSQAARLLSDDGNFLLWFQRYAYPAMTQRVPEHGADLERWMGRRSFVIDIMDEMEMVEPGFLSRLLAARDRYAQELLAVEEQPQKEE